MSILLGAVADDFTGATDLANMLVRAGMRTVQLIGVPPDDYSPRGVDAVVVALKSRTIPAAEAVSASLAALEWLRRAGARQFYFKYCSTFDSTAEGNIGPVTDALMDALGAGFTIACPAFPENRRTLYRGHLFVGDALLNESGMQNHPLTPMRDANLVRVLQAQTRRKVGLVPWPRVASGAATLRQSFEDLARAGTGIAIVDAVRDEDLMAIGAACAELPLVTAGSGIALGLPQNFVAKGMLSERNNAAALAAVPGLSAIVSGSCSAATLGQVRDFAARRPAFVVDALAVATGDPVVGEALKFAEKNLPSGPILVYASAPPEVVAAVQARLGAAKAGALVEQVLADIAAGLVQLGVRRLIVAGGETAGAVVQRLGVRGLQIGVQIDPGVPWTVAIGATPIALALKSGNFGSVDFFSRAWGLMP